MLVLMPLLATGCLVRSQTGGTGRPVEASQKIPPASDPVPSPILRTGPFVAFSGQWSTHVATFWISGDGVAHLDWRTYRLCNGDDGPGPCDEVGASATLGPHNFVGRAIVDFRLNRATGNGIAIGEVTKSNDPQLEVGSQLTLTLRDVSHLLATTDAFTNRLFCSDDHPLPTSECN